MRLSLFGRLDRRLAPASPPARVGWLASVTYAHRGLHGAGAVENSPAAFRAALAAGLGIECDVQVSADGEAMVFHDWDLDRLTEATGLVRRRSAAELAATALRDGGGDRIPTLADLLAEVRGRAPLLIEIKSRRDVRFEPLAGAVRDALAGYSGPVAVMSFDPRVVRWFASNAPQQVRGLVVSEEGARGTRGRWRRHAALWHAAAEFLAYDIRDLPSRFAEAQRARGLPLLTWTVRAPDLRQRAALHADAAIAEGPGVDRR